MLAYAAAGRRIAGRSNSPRALALILAGHAALIAAVMAAKVTPWDPNGAANRLRKPVAPTSRDAPGW